MPTFQITINDTNPIWGYCGQTGHCQAGMVFGFNTPAYGNTFHVFQRLARESNASTPTTPSSSSSASGTMTAVSAAQTGKDHAIVVGPNGQLIYSPANITAMPGDTVTFSFRQKNHTGAVFSVFILQVIELTRSPLQSRNQISPIPAFLSRIRRAQRVSCLACKHISFELQFVMVLISPTQHACSGWCHKWLPLIPNPG
jgi:plastocyanin